MTNCFLLLFTVIPFLQTDGYYNITATAFFELPAVNKSIEADNLDKELLESAIFHATNLIRESKRLNSFTYNQGLNNAASGHAQYLSRYKYFDHLNRKDKTLRTPMQRIQAQGENFNKTAENLAQLNVLDLGRKMEYFEDEQGNLTHENGSPVYPHTYKSLALKVVDGWMHSKGHRENILDDYNYLGCGISDITFTRNNLPEIILIQNFGRK